VKKLVIVGAGGHAKVVVDILVSSGRGTDVLGFVDDDAAIHGQRRAGLPVLGALETLRESDVALVMGIGHNGARRRVFERARSLGYDIVSVVHSTAVIAPRCQLGTGVVVMANVAVNVDSNIGDNVVLNTACSVDHDCVIAAHSHIAPGAHVAGNVSIGAETLVGIGAVVIPGRRIGARCIIGAGAAVVDDVADDSVAVGVPARVVRLVSR